MIFDSHLYFGFPDSTAIRSTETPLGLLCGHCEEPIEEGERGAISPLVRMGEDGGPVADILILHWECHVRRTAGSVAHINEECTCFGGPVLHDNERWETKRAGAGAGLAAWEQRARKGL